jgi:hypothetical protein
VAKPPAVSSDLMYADFPSMSQLKSSNAIESHHSSTPSNPLHSKRNPAINRTTSADVLSANKAAKISMMKNVANKKHLSVTRASNFIKSPSPVNIAQVNIDYFKGQKNLTRNGIEQSQSVSFSKSTKKNDSNQNKLNESNIRDDFSKNASKRIFFDSVDHPSPSIDHFSNNINDCALSNKKDLFHSSFFQPPAPPDLEQSQFVGAKPNYLDLNLNARRVITFCLIFFFVSCQNYFSSLTALANSVL